MLERFKLSAHVALAENGMDGEGIGLYEKLVPTSR